MYNPFSRHYLPYHVTHPLLTSPLHLPQPLPHLSRPLPSQGLLSRPLLQAPSSHTHRSSVGSARSGIATHSVQSRNAPHSGASVRSGLSGEPLVSAPSRSAVRTRSTREQRQSRVTGHPRNPGPALRAETAGIVVRLRCHTSTKIRKSEGRQMPSSYTHITHDASAILYA